MQIKELKPRTNQEGVATLVNILLISTIIMLVAIYGVIISVIFLNSAYNERLASEALVAARSGAQDAIIRVIRYKNCPTVNGCPASYTLEVDGNTADVTITDAGGGNITISSTGIVLLRQKRIVAELGVDTETGEVRIQSFREVALGNPSYSQGTYYSEGSYASWTCGDALVDTRDSKSYATVLIGTQCWMAEHINIGTMLAGASNQTNNGTIEKYCYNDTESNCTSDGGLYQWDEAMQYLTSPGAQGICPADWHIPTDNELITLEENQGMCSGTGVGCSGATGWRGTNEGTKLKVGGSSGFEGLLAGYRNPNGLFYDRAAFAFIWSSVESGSDAWSRYLSSGNTTVYRNFVDKLHGFSIRCLQN